METIRCSACGKLSPVKNCTYIQTYWYTLPHGCTGGDYWNLGEGQFLCPNCETRNRLIFKSSESIVKNKNEFKQVVRLDLAPPGHRREGLELVSWVNHRS